MKTISNILALLLLLSFTQVFGQKEYVLPFGYSQDQVRSYCQQNILLKVQVDLEDVLVASTGSVDVFYHFTDGKLDYLTMGKDITSSRKAQEATQNYTWFFEHTPSWVKARTETENSFSLNAYVSHNEFNINWSEIEPGRYRLNVVVSPTSVSLDQMTEDLDNKLEFMVSAY